MNKITFHRQGVLFVVSAPSGAGKTTLINGLGADAGFVYSVSCTTRAPRQGEVDGQAYFFLSDEAFQARVAAGDFLEYAGVHGRFYGTPKSFVCGHLAAGRDVLVDVDTAGAASIRACGDPIIRSSLVDIFLMPPGLDELRRRLTARGTENAAEIALRVHNAAGEMAQWSHYRYTIPSGTVEENVAAFRAIMTAERLSTKRLRIT